MKIIVCSLYINEWYRNIVKYGKISLENYCKKHNYEFYYETENTPNSVYDNKRDIPWYKIKLLLKILNTTDCDFIVWNDADSQIVNDEKKLEDFIISDLQDKDILVGREHNSVLNTGTMFLRNCQYVKTLLRYVWDNCGKFNKAFHEQASLSNLYERNVMRCRDRIVILPAYRQNDFLTYWYMYISGESFIVHATRCSHDRQGFVFTMDMFCFVKMDEETDDQYTNRLVRLSGDGIKSDIARYMNGGDRRNLSVRYFMKF